MSETVEKPKPTGLALLREPFPENQISKLPKESRTQADDRKAKKQGCMVWKCEVCGGAHHKDATHLDYVGHAALTDRLLDCDPMWNWEPVDMPGLPGPGHGMWIKLTVCDVSRLGYGAADGKTGGDAIKEIIGDALRNAAMRFGAALDLWHKGDLHADNADEEPVPKPEQKKRDAGPAQTGVITNDQFMDIAHLIAQTNTDPLAFCKAYGIATVNELPAAKLADATKALNNKLKKQGAAE